MLRSKRLIFNSSSTIHAIISPRVFTYDHNPYLPLHHLAQRTSARFLDIFQIGNKAAIEKERARLSDEMNRGYFADFAELKQHGGKIAMANKILIPAMTAMKFPALEVNYPDGRTIKLPISANTNDVDVDKSEIPKASLLCLLFRANSQAMIDSWSVPFVDAFSESKEIQLYEVSFIDSWLLSLKPIKRLLLPMMKKSNPNERKGALERHIVYRTEEEFLAIGGLDAVVFIRILVFSIRIFSIAAVICIFLVLPLNYFGKEMEHKQIPAESLDVFTIVNVQEKSRWLWAHCLALYIITCSACLLLYIEYKRVTKLRLQHITTSPPNPSHFAVLVRSIPWSSEESYSDSVGKFFSNYHAASYLSHQMVYRSGTVQKLMSEAEKMYKVLKHIDKACTPSLMRCGLCGATATSFKILSSETDSVKEKDHFGDLELSTSEKECAAAFVFFKTRYAAFVASRVLQSSNPMVWVTDLAPEPHDVYWSNLCIPYRQLWIRKIAILLASIIFMFLFLVPVTVVQTLTQLDHLHRTFPFLKGILRKKFVSQIATGYLPSVVLMLFLYIVPPIMMLFSVVEGCISRSGRKKSACCKVLYFTIWNVFFVNVLSGSVISRLNAISSPKDIPPLLASAVPGQASFFMTYVLTSGWTSLACELMQLFALLCNLFRRFILRKKGDPSNVALSFPYHTEVPKVLFFGLLGFTCSVLNPLILPLLLIYFSMAYLVYRNQILNVYVTKYESGGQLWPVVHNTTIFSLILTQVIALGLFGLKRSPVASGFTVPLIICTLLFNEYCRQRFHPIFKKNAASILIEMDRQDEQSGRIEEIYQQFHTAYCQFTLTSHEFCTAGHHHHVDEGSVRDTVAMCMNDSEAVNINDSEVLSIKDSETVSVKDSEVMKPGKESSPITATWSVRCSIDREERTEK